GGGRDEFRGVLQLHRHPDAVGRQDHAESEGVAAETGQQDDDPGIHRCASFTEDRAGVARVVSPAAMPATIATATPRCMGAARATTAVTAAVSAARRLAAVASLGTS